MNRNRGLSSCKTKKEQSNKGFLETELHCNSPGHEKKAKKQKIRNIYLIFHIIHQSLLDDVSNQNALNFCNAEVNNKEFLYNTKRTPLNRTYGMCTNIPRSTKPFDRHQR